MPRSPRDYSARPIFLPSASRAASLRAMRIVLAPLALIVLSACAQREPGPAVPERMPPAPTATASVPLPADVVAVGIVKSQIGAEVKVGSQLSGIVARLHVNVGDVVKRGDALAELDDAQWRARVTSLEAELAAAQ